MSAALCVSDKRARRQMEEDKGDDTASSVFKAHRALQGLSLQVLSFTPLSQWPHWFSKHYSQCVLAVYLYICGLGIFQSTRIICALPLPAWNSGKLRSQASYTTVKRSSARLKTFQQEECVISNICLNCDHFSMQMLFLRMAEECLISSVVTVNSQAKERWRRKEEDTLLVTYT